jgi:mRNA interferase RelE/StbE
MAYKFAFTPKAKKDFDALDRAVKVQVQKVIDKIESNSDPRVFGEKLTGNLAGYIKYRAGKYRIVAYLQDEVVTVLAIAIGKREIIYEIANKRRR